MARTTGSHLITQALQLDGVKDVFTIVGDHTLPLMDVMWESGIKFWDTRHESAAVHMADAYGQITHSPGVTLVTTPGHANAIAGLAHAWHSESPVIHISGSTEQQDLGRGGMQEIDQVGMARPVTKGAWLVPDALRVPEYIARAFRTALSGRWGPVSLTIPLDVQNQVVEGDEVRWIPPSEYRAPQDAQASAGAIAKACRILREAKRPVVIAGSAAGCTATGEQLRRFIELTRLPLYTEFQARGMVPDDHPNCIGLGDARLSTSVKEALRQTDALLLLGKKLDFTIGFGGPQVINEHAAVIHIDPEASEIGRNRGAAAGIVGPVGPVIDQLTGACAEFGWQRSGWVDELQSIRDAELSELNALAVPEVPMHAAAIHRAVAPFLRGETRLVLDAGDFTLLGGQYHEARRHTHWLFQSTLGMIGPGVPMAIGAQIARPAERVFLLVGDGSFGFHGMEYDTAVRLNVPIVGVMGNDASWGIDWQIQMGVYGRTVASDLLPTRYDRIVEAMGGHGEHVERCEDLAPAIERAIASGRPALVNVQMKRAPSPLALSHIENKKRRLPVL